MSRMIYTGNDGVLLGTQHVHMCVYEGKQRGSGRATKLYYSAALLMAFLIGEFFSRFFLFFSKIRKNT